MSTTQDLANGVQAYINSIQAAVTDPADAISIFTQMLQFPINAATASQIGLEQTQLMSNMADLCRRQVICALAQTASYYQPTSYDDAANLRTQICALIDDEILTAGDQGEDDVYLALKQLRASVVKDLTSRGATLAPLTTVNIPASQPSLALAYRLYQDITRTDQLTAFGNPPHPAFMPTSFKALSS